MTPASRRLISVPALVLVVVAAACTTSKAAEEPTTTAETSGAAVTTSSTLPPPAATPPPTSTPTSAVPPPPTTLATTTLAAPAPDPTKAAIRLAADIGVLRRIGPRVGGTPPEAETFTWIEEELTALGLAAVTEPVPLPTGDVSQNLWVTIGDGPVHVLLGSHVDSVTDSAGIDDNGSGVVLLRELARRLATDPPTGLTVTLAWFGSEEVLPGRPRNDHHFGSRAMAARLAAADALPHWMVSVDMVGLGDRLVGATYHDTDPAAARLLAQAAADVDVELTVIERGDISDHEGFARAGVPAVFMWRPDNPRWHTPDDDRVDLDHLLVDLAILERFLALAAS